MFRIKSFPVYGLAILVLALSTSTAIAQEIPTLFGVIPQEGQAGSEVRLTLDGTGFQALEGLDGVFISGVEVPVLGYDIASNERIEVLIFIPEETPIGETEISFLFGNFALDAFFIVVGPGAEPLQPGPPEVPPPVEGPDWGILILVVVFVVVLVGTVPRLFRKEPEKPEKKPRREPTPALPEFDVRVDPGVQQIEPANQPLKMDIDLSFIVSIDSGEGHIELHQSRLVESK